MNAKHITEISINNFRGFANLKLTDLQAVNLIVGQNNAGKTSLLEALTIACNPPDIHQLPGLLRANAGNVDQRFFRWLLKDAAGIGEGSIAATIGSVENRISFYRTLPKQHSALVLQTAALSMVTDPNMPRLKARVVSVQYRKPAELVASFGNAVRKRAGEEMMHSILRAVDPRISRVRVDPVQEGNIITVDIGLTESIPLPQAGQGVYRLVAVLSDLIGDTPQVCIIDEIENGLHHTVLKQVWRGLAEISRQLGVQIFATTHSHECLMAAHSVFFDEDKAKERDFAVIQLMRLEDRIEGKVLNEERVNAAIENDIELR